MRDLAAPSLAAYETHARQKADYNRRATMAGQEIGPIPRVANVRRRSAARDSLQKHLEVYHPEIFDRPWASYHFKLLACVEACVHRGGWFAMAVPRGGGKTSIAICSIEWALLHGYKRWPVLVGSTADRGEAMLRILKNQLLLNDVLMADFPEICVPIRHIKGAARKCEGQLCMGESTGIRWGQNEIVMAEIPERERQRWCLESFGKNKKKWPPDTGGSRINTMGITSAMRGMSAATRKLDVIRPDFAIADDPQTRESARSYMQSQTLLATLKGDVAYLSGQGKPMSLVVPCTVISRGDLADMILDRSLSPEWHGERHKMLTTLPTNAELWDQYAELRRECLRLDKPMDECNEFYRSHQAEMDAGASCTWPDNFDETCLSGIQAAMNLKLRDEASFMAEAQNEPVDTATTDSVQCGVLDIIRKHNHVAQGVVPHYVEKLAAHIDVQQRLLYWAIGGASMSFEAAIIDYGTFPDQRRTFFNYSEDGLRTIQHAFPEDPRLEVQLYQAIQGAIAIIASRRFKREDGAEMAVGQILVDSGWNADVVTKACRESPFASIVLPSQGLSVTAKDTPFHLRKQKPGERIGTHWIVKPKPDNKAVRYVQMDVNYWKTQAHLGFRATTSSGSLSLWKDRPERHRMMAEHCTAETPDRVTVRDNTVDEWQLKPHRPDNHHFDNVVGVLVGLSLQECSLARAHDKAPEPRRRPRIIRRPD